MRIAFVAAAFAVTAGAIRLQEIPEPIELAETCMTTGPHAEADTDVATAAELGLHAEAEAETMADGETVAEADADAEFEPKAVYKAISKTLKPLKTIAGTGALAAKTVVGAASDVCGTISNISKLASRYKETVGAVDEVKDNISAMFAKHRDNIKDQHIK